MPNKIELQGRYMKMVVHSAIEKSYHAHLRRWGESNYTTVPYPFHPLLYIFSQSKSVMFYLRGGKFFKKSSSHIRILGSRRVTRGKFHTDGPQILGDTVRELVVR